MMAPENFYTSGGTLGRSAPSYVTRRADGELLGYLLRGEFCYVLTSRQMGKSSLMVRTAAALKAEGYNVAILDLTRIGQNVSIEQWYGGLLTRLGTDLNLEDQLDDYWMSERAGRQGPMQRFMSALREVVFPAIKGNLVVFIDEIDAVRSLPFSSDEFFAGIRECYNSRVQEPEFNRITFCLLGVAQPSDLISNVFITPFNIGHRIELTDFSEKEAEPLLEGLRGRTHKPGGERAILRRILYWTSGHPYLTQKLCEAVTQLERPLTPDDIDAACGDLFLSTRSREQQDNLIFVRDRVLASQEHRASILDLYDKVRRGEKVRDDDSNTTIDPLRLSGLLVVSHGFLKVRNRIYCEVFDRKWVAANMPDAEVRRQKAAYRRGVMKTVAISVPVAAVVIVLAVFVFFQSRKTARSYYLATTASAQQAFNVGDFTTGRDILKKWQTDGQEDGQEDPREANKQHDPHENFIEVFKHRIEGREQLENTFAMRLLEDEASGGGGCALKRQDSSDPPGVRGCDPKAVTSCAAVTTVATAMYQDKGKQIPLVAVAGSDSSVQIWDAKTQAPLHHLQLASDQNGYVALTGPPDTTPLLDCDKDSGVPGVMALSFSPDGTKLAIATGTWRHPVSPGYVVVWDLTNASGPQSVSVMGKDVVADLGTEPNQQWSFPKTTDSISWTAMPDRRVYLGASSEDGTARLWEYHSASPSQLVDPKTLCLPGGDSVGGRGANVIAFSGRLMALGYGDGHLVLYDLVRSFEKPVYVGIVQVSGIMSMTFLEQKDRLTLVIGSRDGDMVLLDPAMLPHSEVSTAVSACPRSSSTNHQENSSRTGFRATLAPNQGVLQGLAVAYNKDKSKAWLLTSGSNGTVGLWTVTPDFHLEQKFTGAHDGVHAATFCPGDELNCIISASSDNDARLWNYPYRETTFHSHVMPDHVKLHFPGQMIGVEFPAPIHVGLPGPIGGKLVTAVGATLQGDTDDLGTVALWDPGGKEPRELNGDRGVQLLGFDVAPDQRFIAATSRTRNLDLLDPLTGVHQTLHVEATLNPKIRIRCLDPDAKHIIQNCASDQRDYLIIGVADQVDKAAKGLCMWHVRDNGSQATERFTVEDRGWINPCKTDLNNPGGADIGFLKATQQIVMFDISVGGAYIVTSDDQVDGKTAVSLSNSADLLAGKVNWRTYPFDPGAQFTDMSFSPEPSGLPKYIVATTIDSRMYYWPASQRSSKVAPKREKLPTRGQALAFSPSDPVLAVGLQDGRILLWDTDQRWISSSGTWSQLMEVRQHRGGVLGLAFSPDGGTLASAGNDGLVTLLQAPSTH